MKFELKPVEQRLTACTVFIGVVVGLAGFAAPRTQAQTFTVLYNFKPAPDGGTPYGGLLNVNGTFYGTTYGGGGSSDGTVFKLTGSDNESVLYSFKGGSDGTHPFYESLVNDSAGNFYGTTFTGGAGGCTPPGCGIVFKLAGKKESVLHSFSGTPDGSVPSAGLLLDSAGNLYGTTRYGGTSNLGAVFKITKALKETVLYSFKGGADGEQPYADLIMDAKGNLYGTTTKGGSAGAGIVFKLSKSGTETVLYSFMASPDGAVPQAGLIIDTLGNLYGTTTFGGKSGFGTVFELTKSRKETVLYNFTGGADGGYPYARLLRKANGNLYSTTYRGGASSRGTVFEVRGSIETVLHNFDQNDGAYPTAGLIMDKKGNFYGTASQGGTSGPGVVFKLTP